MRASPSHPDAAPADWRDVADIGRVRLQRRKTGRDRWFLDFSPYLKGSARYLMSDRGHALDNAEHAERVLGWIQGLLGRGMHLEDAVGEYRQLRSRPNLVKGRLATWIAELERDYAPYTVAQYRSYLKDGGHFSYWDKHTVHDVSWASLEAWVGWLRERGQSGKSIRNILASFRSFWSWLRRRDARLPQLEFPRVKSERRTRRAMRPADQAAALRAVPEADRGIFLALAHTIRPGEARAARVGHYDFGTGRLWIGEALKGKGANAKRGETKTGEVGKYELSSNLRDWIERHVAGERRLDRDAPLFPNPRTGKPYGANRLRDLWVRACQDAKVEYVPLYEALKHSTITALLEDGIALEDVQALARHRDERTTRIYDLGGDARRARALRRRDELASRPQTGPTRFTASRGRKRAKPLGRFGGPSGTRTLDPRVKSPVLYQLS